MRSINIEKESEMGDEFRVRVSMERYFSDERARCYMMVRRGRDVRWLARRLRRTFRLPPPPARLALLCHGHLLPPDEPLAILAPDDTLEVIPASAVVGLDENSEDENLERLSSGGGADGEEVMASSPGVVVSSPAGGGDKVDGTNGDLEEMKQRALQLLDGWSAPQPRRRRRTRRRRLPHSDVSAPEPTTDPKLEPLADPAECTLGEPTMDNDDDDDDVVREASVSRPARLVHALPSR